MSLQDLHKRVFQPPGSSLMASLEHEPTEAKAKPRYMEALRKELTGRQLRLLRRTCRHFERHWKWLSAERLSGSDKRSLRGNAAGYVLRRGDGTVVATRSGRMLREHLSENSNIISKHKRANL